MRTYTHHDFMAEDLDDEAFSGVSYSLFSGLSGNGVHTHFLRSLFARTGDFKTFCRSNVLLYEYLSIPIVPYQRLFFSRHPTPQRHVPLRWLAVSLFPNVVLLVRSRCVYVYVVEVFGFSTAFTLHSVSVSFYLACPEENVEKTLGSHGDLILSQVAIKSKPSAIL